MLSLIIDSPWNGLKLLEVFKSGKPHDTPTFGPNYHHCGYCFQQSSPRSIQCPTVSEIAGCACEKGPQGQVLPCSPDVKPRPLTKWECFKTGRVRCNNATRPGQILVQFPQIWQVMACFPALWMAWNGICTCNSNMHFSIRQIKIVAV